MNDRTTAIVVWSAVLAGLMAIAVCATVIVDLFRGGVAMLSIFGGGVL